MPAAKAGSVSLSTASTAAAAHGPGDGAALTVSLASALAGDLGRVGRVCAPGRAGADFPAPEAALSHATGAQSRSADTNEIHLPAMFTRLRCLVPDRRRSGRPTYHRPPPRAAPPSACAAV